MAIDPRTGQPLPEVAAGVPGVPIQLPEETIHTGWHSGTTKQGSQVTETLPTPEAAQALADLGGAQRARVAAADRRLAADEPILEAEAHAADDQRKAAEEMEIQREQARQEGHAEVQKRQHIAEQRRAEMMAAGHPTTYWQDKGAPGKVLAAFLTGLGHYASAQGGGPNGALETYRHAETLDRQNKIDAFMRTKEFHELAQNDVEAAKHALADHLAEINNEELVRGRIIDKRLAALTKRLNIPQAQAKYEEWRAGRQADDAEKMAAEYQHYSRKVEGERTTTTKGAEGSHTVNVNKPASEGANRAAAFQMQQASTGAALNEDLKKVDKANVPPEIWRQAYNNFLRMPVGHGGLISSVATAAGRALPIPFGGGKHVVPTAPTDGIDSKYHEAINSAYQAAQKAATLLMKGASQSESHTRQAELTFFPTGESKQEIADKFAKMREQAAGAEVTGGKYSQPVRAAMGAADEGSRAPAAPVKTAPQSSGHHGTTRIGNDGNPYVLINGKWRAAN